jgi:hypothetical protein
LISNENLPAYKFKFFHSSFKITCSRERTTATIEIVIRREEKKSRRWIMTRRENQKHEKKSDLKNEKRKPLHSANRHKQMILGKLKERRGGGKEGDGGKEKKKKERVARNHTQTQVVNFCSLTS